MSSPNNWWRFGSRSRYNELVMDLEDAGSRARYLIRDRDGKFPALLEAVLVDAGVKVVLSGIQTPRMNSIMERWVRTCTARRAPPPDQSPDRPCRPALVMSGRARTRHTYDGTRRDGRMT